MRLLHLYIFHTRYSVFELFLPDFCPMIPKRFVYCRGSTFCGGKLPLIFGLFSEGKEHQGDTVQRYVQEVPRGFIPNEQISAQQQV